MKKLISLSVLVFTIAFISNTPAYFFYQPFSTTIPAQLSNIEGTLWKGSARLTIAGTPIGKTQWQFQPVKLIQAQLGWQLSFPEIETIGEFSFYPWDPQTVKTLSVTSSSIGLARINPALNGIHANVNAELSDLNALTCLDSMKGTASISDTRALGLSLGVVDAEISCDKQQYIFSFANTKAPIKLQGDGSFVAAGQYLIKGELATDDPATQSKLTALLGPAQSGRFVFQESGHL